MTDYIYLCPNCAKSAVISNDELNIKYPCTVCNSEIRLSEVTPDVREAEWDLDEYGFIKDAWEFDGQISESEISELDGDVIIK